MAEHYSQTGLVPTTPKLIRLLIVCNLIFGCLSGLFASLLGEYLNISFTNLFALSFSGLKRGFIWQPFTFMFLPEIEGSLSFYFLFTLCFDLYLLWFIGCRVYRQMGQSSTLRLFFLPTILSCTLVTALSETLHMSSPLFGLSFSMIPLIMGYCFSNPQERFAFFPTQAIRVRWLGLGLVLLYLFQDLADLHFSALIAHLTLFVLSYFYMLLVEKKGSPFSWTNGIDNFFLRRRKKEKDSKIIYLYETDCSRKDFINQTLDRIGQGQKISPLDRVRLKWYRLRKKKKFKG